MDDFKDYLDDIYIGLGPEEAFNRLEYLTNEKRGEHLEKETLMGFILQGTVAAVIEYFDPVAYNTQKGEWLKC